MRNFFTLVFLILITACNNDDCLETSVCPTKETLDDFPWIVEMKNSITNCSCEVSIIKGSYKGKDVFYVAMTDALCNGMNTPTLFDCEGNEIISFTSSTEDQKVFIENVTTVEVLFRCKN